MGTCVYIFTCVSIFLLTGWFTHPHATTGHDSRLGWILPQRPGQSSSPPPAVMELLGTSSSSQLQDQATKRTEQPVASSSSSIAIRSSEGGAEQPSSPSPPMHAIQAIRIISYRVRQPFPPTETYIDTDAVGGSGRESVGLVRRLKQQRREGRPFIVYVLKVCVD